MGEREFVPGIYKHWKKGKLYIARRIMHKHDGEKLIVYSPLAEPLVETCRDFEEFMSDSPDSEENTTGQLYRYEYITDQFVVYKRTSKNPQKYVDKIDISRRLQLGDCVIIELEDHEIVAGILDVMGTRTVKVRESDGQFRTINWLNILEFTKLVDTGL